ncbi:hypothetical protein MTO96_028770 [Rhipicephalus appendiculatus]
MKDVKLDRFSKWIYLHRCVAMVMGMGSLWRFPTLTYDQGRGAFLICYLIMNFLLAMPLCQIEIALAQFTGSSIKSLWKCMPLGRGIGVAGCYCAALVSVYNALVLAYATMYFCDSLLYPELPWTHCGPGWGADASCYGLMDAQREVLTAAQYNCLDNHAQLCLVVFELALCLLIKLYADPAGFSSGDFEKEFRVKRCCLVEFSSCMILECLNGILPLRQRNCYEVPT